MTSSFQDTVLDFDLNFLQQQSSNAEIESKLEKQKKAIFIAKKKTIATDLLIRKYYDKKDQLDQTEVRLLASKEECKQICIDYKNSVEKCTQLEKDLQVLKSQYGELEQNYIMSQNQVEAMKSHARQLQDLVKENETVIESMKIDNSLEKSNTKDYEKKILALQKEHDEVLKQLRLACDIALGKKKLQKHHKPILQKYTSSIIEKDPECSLSEDSSEETDFCEEPSASPLYTVIEICPELELNKEVDTKIDGKECINQDVRRLLDDHESDYSNGVTSEDTGRGSSLAFSDSEKCVHSPDYFVTDSPPEESNNHMDRKKVTNASTSPRKNNEIVHRATSPITFDVENLPKDNKIQQIPVGNMYSITDMPLSNEIVNIIEKPKMFDVATSPVRDMEKVTVATSPIIFMDIIDTSEVAQISKTNNSSTNLELSSNENNSEGDEKNEETNHSLCKDLPSDSEHEMSESINEKTCLERNNSTNLQEENSNDHEVEMILNSMQLRHKLITPLPQTPVKLSRKIRRPLEAAGEKLNVEKHSCPDAIELKEENKLLKSSIADLSKEILNIKLILKKQLIMPESPKKSPTAVNAESLETTQFDASQESISIVCDDDVNSTAIRNKSFVKFDKGVSKTGPSEVYGVVPEKNIETPLSTDEQLSPCLTNNNHVGHIPIDSPHTSLELHIADCIQENQLSPSLTNSNKVDSVPKASPDNMSELERKIQSKNCVIEREQTNVPQIRCENVNFLENDLHSEENTVPIRREEDVEDSCPNTKQKIGKTKKLSRLDRFRRRLIPKSKIKFKALPTPKRRKCKIIPVNKLNLSDNVLSNKIAYEKAMKVMKELKLKQDSLKNNINSVNKKVENKNVEKLDTEKTEVHRKDDVEYLCRNKIEPKQFVICLPRLNLEKEIQSIKESKNLEKSQNKLNCSGYSEPDKEKQHSNETDTASSPNVRTTRSKSKISEQNDDIPSLKSPRKVTEQDADEIIKKYDRTERVRRRLKRVASDNSDISCKRILRSSIRDSCTSTDEDMTLSELSSPRRTSKSNIITNSAENSFREDGINKTDSNIEISNVEIHGIDNIDVVSCNSVQECDPRQSILCKMIEKYGRGSEKTAPKKIPENITNQIYKKLETDITNITKLHVDEFKPAVNKLVEEIKELNIKHFMAGLMKYLKDPSRKQELFSKVASAPAPSMTKSEQVLLYILKELQINRPDFVNLFLTHIEYCLFHLNKTPEFDVIESLSHFYALTCRYFRLKTRLRLFLLDAMYCLQFKVVPLIKQCLDVWMHILPLAHMGIAKSPLVTCLVYLLHFYKCEDRFNRIQEIRMILNKKYFYKMSDWNEPKMLEMFRNCLIELKDIPLEKKMLRLAFIILAKRQGPRWCEKNIIKNMLTPLIDKENVPSRTKKFCVSLYGPLLKPYPKDMKVNCEIAVNYLLDKLEKNPQDDMKEAIFTSLIYMNKHNQNRVTQVLLSWSPKQPSEDFEELMRDFVREKPVRVWKSVLSKITL